MSVVIEVDGQGHNFRIICNCYSYFFRSLVSFPRKLNEAGVAPAVKDREKQEESFLTNGKGRKERRDKGRK